MSQRNINRLFVHSILLCVTLSPVVGNALDLTIEPRIQAGVMDYQFEQKPVEFTTAATGKSIDHGFKVVSVLPFVGGGATLFANRFFFDVYLQNALSGSDSASNPSESSKLDEDLGLPIINQIIYSKFDREEYSLSVGYAVGSQWALFVGYRTSKTSFSDTIRFAEDVTLQTDVGSFPATVTGSGKRSIDFKQDGYFLGGAYAFIIGEHAVVTFNAALAVLDGKYDSRGDIDITAAATVNGTPVSSTESTALGFDFDGGTVGLNLGVAWKGRLVESLSYALGVNGYSYDFDAKEKEVADLSESVLRFSAGLSYQF